MVINPEISLKNHISILIILYLTQYHGDWNRVSLRGSPTNERSIWNGGKICTLWRQWLKLLVENSQTVKEMPITIMRILAYNRSYPKTVLGPVSTLCPVPGFDVGKVQKLESLELYDYLTLFQYPWLRHFLGRALRPRVRLRYDTFFAERCG